MDADLRDRKISLVYLDDYHAGDVLFIQSLAHALARMKARRVVLVHGSGEHAERALEAQGIFRTRVHGVLPVETADEHTLVEKALRHVNRKITGALTDAVVPAIGIVGSERGLLRIKGGRVCVENAGWVEGLSRQGVVAVVAAFAMDDASGRTGEVPLHLVVEALYRTLSTPAEVVIFTKTNLPGVMERGSPRSSAPADVLNDRIVSEPEAVAYLASTDLSVLLTNTTGLSERDGSAGTRIRTST